MVHLTVSGSGDRVMSGRWRPNAAAPCRAVAAERGRVMSGGGGRTRQRHVGRWRPNAAAPCRAVAAERGRAMSGGGGRTRPRHVGRWRPNAAAPCRAVAAESCRAVAAAEPCRAVAAECGRAMSGSGGRTRPRHFGWWRRPNAAALCRAVAAARGRTMSGCPNGPQYLCLCLWFALWRRAHAPYVNRTAEVGIHHLLFSPERLLPSAKWRLPDSCRLLLEKKLAPASFVSVPSWYCTVLLLVAAHGW